MSYFKIVNQIKENKVASVYLLYGLETYFIQNIQKALVKSILGDDAEENLSVYDLEEVPVEEVITDAETYPFFGDRKLIFVHHPLFLTAQQKKLPFDHDLKVLERYLASPVDYSTLVFIAPYEKLDNRKKITKLFKKHTTTVECNPIKDNEIGKWIKNLADELHIKIAPDAYEVFETELIVNLHLIQNELMKLATYVGENGEITKEIAQDLIAQTDTSTALRLVDAVMERNLHQAISIYKDLERMNEEPIALIALLAFQFRIIYRVKLLRRKGYNQFQIQKQVGAHPYVIKIAGNREKHFSIERLQHIIDQLAETDAVMKQGKMEKDIAFELLLYELIQSS